MYRIRLPWLVLSAILALAACQSASEIDGVALTTEADAEVELLAVARPWKGWYDWVVTYIEWDDDGPGPGKSDFGGLCVTPSDYLVRSVGSGQLSHMGRVAYTNDHCARAWDGSYDGVMSFEAADGSSVFTTYTGGVTVDFEVEAFVVASEFTIVGGTGRFKGASGGGPGGAWLAWADQEALFTGQTSLREWVDGAIVYDPGKALGR